MIVNFSWKIVVDFFVFTPMQREQLVLRYNANYAVFDVSLTHSTRQASVSNVAVYKCLCFTLNKTHSHTLPAPILSNSTHVYTQQQFHEFLYKIEQKISSFVFYLANCIGATLFVDRKSHY